MPPAVLALPIVQRASNTRLEGRCEMGCDLLRPGNALLGIGMPRHWGLVLIDDRVPPSRVEPVFSQQDVWAMASSDGDDVFSVLAAVAEDEARRISERAKAALPPSTPPELIFGGSR